MTEERPFTAWWLHARRQRALADAVVGAWTWVQRMGTAGLGTRHAARFGALGEASAFSWPPGPTMNPHLVHIGAGCLLGAESTWSVGMWPGEELPGPVITVGDRVNVGRRCAFVGRERIEVGDDVTFAPDVYVTDHDHRYDDPDTPITRQWVRSAPVSIGSGTWLGTRVVVLPGTTIGRNVVVAAGAVVRGEVPDHSVVAGVPAKVLRRYLDGVWDPPLGDAESSDQPPEGWGG